MVVSRVPGLANAAVGSHVSRVQIAKRVCCELGWKRWDIQDAAQGICGDQRGAVKRDYAHLHVPVLTFFALPASATDILPGHYKPKNDQERVAIEEVYSAVVNYIHTDEKSIESAAFGARVIGLPGADQYRLPI